MDIASIIRRFEECGADDMAVVDGDGHVLGMLTEAYVRKRYGDELDRAQRELYGEDLAERSPFAGGSHK
jgi:chloride channel protein, CIC family